MTDATSRFASDSSADTSKEFCTPGTSRTFVGIFSIPDGSEGPAGGAEEALADGAGAELDVAGIEDADADAAGIDDVDADADPLGAGADAAAEPDAAGFAPAATAVTMATTTKTSAPSPTEPLDIPPA